MTPWRLRPAGAKGRVEPFMAACRPCRLRWRMVARRLSGAPMIRGSCLCGRVKYRINGRPFDALNCHCSMCRKAHGAAFRSRATLKAADFEWVQGEGCVTFYESSPGNHRGFCRVCGSPIVSKFDAHPNYLGLPLGALDDDPGIRPKVHMHVASKAPWFTITDDLPQIPGEASGPAGATRTGK